MDIWVVPTFILFYFFVCVSSLLGHMGSSLHHTGSSTVARRLSGCGVWGSQLRHSLGDLSSLTRN